MEITPSETDADMNLSAPAAEEDTKVPTSEEKIEEVKEGRSTGCGRGQIIRQNRADTGR